MHKREIARREVVSALKERALKSIYLIPWRSGSNFKGSTIEATISWLNASLSLVWGGTKRDFTWCSSGEKDIADSSNSTCLVSVLPH